MAIANQYLMKKRSGIVDACTFVHASYDYVCVPQQLAAGLCASYVRTTERRLDCGHWMAQKNRRS